MSEVIYVPDIGILIRNIEIEITTPNKRNGYLIDSRFQPVWGEVIAGSHEGQIMLGIKSENGFQFGFVMNSEIAIALAGVLTDAACAKDTKQ